MKTIPTPNDPLACRRSLLSHLLFVCLLADACGDLAAEPILITPRQVISNALIHSRQLRVLDSEVVAAGAKLDQARAQALPVLSAEARATQYTGLEEMRFGPLFTIPAIETRSGAGLVINQPAYTGGRLKSQRESAVRQKDAARHERQGAAADVALQALNAYWNWSKAFYAGASLEAAVARMEAHARDMHSLHENGLATDNDSLATDVLLDKTRLRFSEARRRIEVAQARIAFLTGLAPSPLHQPEKPLAAAASLPPAEEALLETARTHRSERAARQSEIQAAEAQVKATRADYYPQVSLTARYEQARPNLNNLPPADKWQDDAYAGVAVSWSLFDWGLRKAKVAEAKAKAQQVRLRADQTDDQITLEVREARINVQDARQRLEVAERTLRSAQRNLQAATDLWHNGLNRHSDVLDAHAQLTDSEYEVTTARADLELARASLEHAVGQLEPQARAGASEVGQTSGLPVPGASGSGPAAPANSRVGDPADRQTGGLPRPPAGPVPPK